MRRYDRIMQAIDEGKTDEELAEMFPDNSVTKKAHLQTIRMYRMAHDEKARRGKSNSASDRKLIMELYWARTGGEREWKLQG